MTKAIWLPESETNVRVTDDGLTVWQDMTMTLRPISKAAGFVADDPEPSRPKPRPKPKR